VSSLLDRLFRLLPKDAGQPSPVYQPRTVSASGAALVVQAAVTNDSNMLWEIENFVGECDPGAAQTVRAMQFRLIYQGTKIFLVAAAPPLAAIAADDSNYLNWSGRILVAPGVQIELLGQFSGAVAVNSVTAHIFGSRVTSGNVNL